MRNATLAIACLAGCARAHSDAEPDAPAAPDAPPEIDAAPDAPPEPGCAISSSTPPVLDGIDDLAQYAAEQHLALGAMLGTDDAAITWDRTRLYITATSNAFTAAYEPLHVYLEAVPALAPAVAASGKEYSGLTAALPFSPTHLIAVRRVTDAGNGPYDGVYKPATGWPKDVSLVPGNDVFVSSDQHTMSVQVPWTLLGGCPHALRLAVHVVHNVPGNEWKDLVPMTHTPWAAPGGGYYEIDLTGAPAVTGWTLR